MNTLRQPQIVEAQAAAYWPETTVLAMNLHLLTHPGLHVQRWFEEQVALHLGCSPHGGRVNPSPIA